MERDGLPEDPAKQWEVLLCIIAFEEKKIDRRPDGALETLTYIYNHKGIRHIFQEWMNQMKLSYDKKTADDEASTKNDEISLIWRQRGNVKFKADAYDDAFKMYTKSLLFADKKGPLYAVALANRSAVSLRLKKYKNCIKDIQRALDHGYPQEFQHKLYLRRAECFLDLGQKQKGVACLEEAVRHNEKFRLTGKSKVDFEKLYRLLEVKIASLKYEIPPEGPFQLPELYKGENPKLKNACSALELARNEEYGRHVIVNEEIKRGDVLFAEPAFAAVRLSDGDLPHPYYCDYCSSSDSAVIGCDDCTRIVYCDEGCSQLGCTLYHQWECPGMRSNIFPVIGMAHLAFRVMVKYAYIGFPRLPNSAGIPTTAARLLAEYANVDKVEIYKKETSVFYTMFNLATSLDTSPNCDGIQYALSATMLVMYLEQNTTFFDYFPERVGYPLPMSEMKLLCAALIFRTFGQLINNAHAIMELNIDQTNDMPNPNIDNTIIIIKSALTACIKFVKNPAKKIKIRPWVLPGLKWCRRNRNNVKQTPVPCTDDPWRKVGTGIYPTASMMNHSCEPNITNLFYKNQLFVKAIRELPKGSEVMNCYGPHYARASTDDRREELRTQYGFNCICPACVDESRKDFVSLFSAYACPSCKGPVTWMGTRMNCHQCPNEFPLQRAQNAAETGDAMHAIAMRAKTPKERCERMVRAHRLLQQVLYRHHNILRKVVDDLAKMYAAIGEYTKSIDLIKQNIQSFEYQFGSFSVEVTNEIRKMANLMIGRIMKYLDNPELDERQPIPIRDWVRETLKIVKKANQLMELHFGTWPTMYKSLMENEEALENMLASPRFHDHTDCFNYRLQSLKFI